MIKTRANKIECKEFELSISSFSSRTELLISPLSLRVELPDEWPRVLNKNENRIPRIIKIVKYKIQLDRLDWFAWLAMRWLARFDGRRAPCRAVSNRGSHLIVTLGVSSLQAVGKVSLFFLVALGALVGGLGVLTSVDLPALSDFLLKSLYFSMYSHLVSSEIGPHVKSNSSFRCR